MKNLFYCCGLIVWIIPSLLFTQPTHRDTALFIQPKHEFWDTIKTSLDRFYKKEETEKKRLRPDFSPFDAPTSVSEFTQYWHTPPISQGITGTCWCFSTTSFLESEVFRLTKRQVKLSEIYTVYWEYVEKARGYVRTRGEQEFGEGSESGAVLRAWTNHGAVPEESYPGLPNGQPFHDHSKLFAELDGYLKSIKTANAWDSTAVESTVRSILNHYLGVPPETFTFDGKQYTPKEYLSKVLKLSMDDYIEFVSFSDRPYNQWTEYDVPDNWWHGKEYFNIPLSEYMALLKKAVRAGYTIVIGGDVSEPGIESHAGIAVIPSFDIPAQYIDENARIFRYYNKTTEDDHGMHLVGYVEKNGRDWYLIKDSSAGSRNSAHTGYFFFDEDYVKLKMLSILLPKSAVPELAEKIK